MKRIFLVPQSYSVYYKEIKETNLWEVYCMVTSRIRKEIQASLESAPKLAERLHLNVKTVLKWKKSTTQQQMKLNSGVFLNCPLDDVYVALKDQIPELSRPNLHR